MSYYLHVILGFFGGATGEVEPDVTLGLHSMSQPPPAGIHDHNFGGTFNTPRGRGNMFRRGGFGKIVVMDGVITEAIILCVFF